MFSIVKIPITLFELAINQKVKINFNDLLTKYLEKNKEFEEFLIELKSLIIKEYVLCDSEELLIKIQQFMDASSKDIQDNFSFSGSSSKAIKVALKSLKRKISYNQYKTIEEDLKNKESGLVVLEKLYNILSSLKPMSKKSVMRALEKIEFSSNEKLDAKFRRVFLEMVMKLQHPEVFFMYEYLNLSTSNLLKGIEDMVDTIRKSKNYRTRVNIYNKGFIAYLNLDNSSDQLLTVNNFIKENDPENAKKIIESLNNLRAYLILNGYSTLVLGLAMGEKYLDDKECVTKILNEIETFIEN